MGVDEFGDRAEEFLTRLKEEHPLWVMGVGALAGVVFLEYQYFTGAEQVRLLFVLLIAPVGAVGGAIAGLILVYGSLLLISISIWAGIILLIFAIIGAIIGFLYNTVVWTN